MSSGIVIDILAKIMTSSSMTTSAGPSATILDSSVPRSMASVHFGQELRSGYSSHLVEPEQDGSDSDSDSDWGNYTLASGREDHRTSDSSEYHQMGGTNGIHKTSCFDNPSPRNGLVLCFSPTKDEYYSSGMRIRTRFCIKLSWVYGNAESWGHFTGDNGFQGVMRIQGRPRAGETTPMEWRGRWGEENLGSRGWIRIMSDGRVTGFLYGVEMTFDGSLGEEGCEHPSVESMVEEWDEYVDTVDVDDAKSRNKWKGL